MLAERQVLIIDDDPAFCRLFISAAKSSGFHAQATTNASDFKNAYESTRPQIIALDLSIPGTDGIEILRYLADRQCQSHILIVSGHGGRVLEAASRLGKARGLNMAGIVSKPMRLSEIQEILAGFLPESNDAIN